MYLYHGLGTEYTQYTCSHYNRHAPYILMCLQGP